MAFWKYEKYLKENTKYPLRDRYDLPSSPLTFEGGAHYRMEIAGVENVSTFEAMLQESERRNTPIHRIIATVKGATLLDNQELKYFAQMAADNKIEVVINPVPSRAWDTGRQYTTKEGYVCGMRLRGQDAVNAYLRELDRCIEAGIKGFLIPDEGLLYLLNNMRQAGVIPPDVKFKVSVFAGHGTAVNGELLENMGADSFNPLADLTLPMLASIRSVVKIPLDVYVSLVDSMGGFQRYHEAPELARICAPIYFKIEPGRSEGEMYNSWADRNYLDFLVREKVKFAQIAKEWVERSGYNLVFNDHRDDLSIPKP